MQGLHFILLELKVCHGGAHRQQALLEHISQGVSVVVVEVEQEDGLGACAAHGPHCFHAKPSEPPLNTRHRFLLDL